MAILPKDRLKGRCESIGLFLLGTLDFWRFCSFPGRLRAAYETHGAVRRKNPFARLRERRLAPFSAAGDGVSLLALE